MTPRPYPYAVLDQRRHDPQAPVTVHRTVAAAIRAAKTLNDGEHWYIPIEWHLLPDEVTLAGEHDPVAGFEE